MTQTSRDPVWLPRAAQREQAWANGGGRTREVAIAPAGATVSGCRWRVSCATVASDGPFSTLPGIDRSLWLVAGTGCVLDLAGRPVRLERRWQRVDFAGECPVTARLLDGPVQDLNVMVARNTTRAEADLLQLGPGATHGLPARGGERLLLLLEGGAAVHGGWLEPGDAVVWTGADPVTVAVGAMPTVLLAASFVAR